MNLELIKTLWDYNYWAHKLVWQSVLTLTPEQFHRNLAYSWGSIHAQVVHVMSAEWMWFNRLQGVFPAAMFDPTDYPTTDDVRAKWDEVEQQVREYLDQLKNEQLMQSCTYKTTSGHEFTQRIGEILFHVANHGTDHRAQILAMLNQLGAPTMEQDLILYLREKAGQPRS